MSKIISCHQPNFLPYLGFFDKMKKSDVFVIRDEVLFSKGDFHHRNRIRVNGYDNLNDPKERWLTVPVNGVEDYIMHILIKNGVERKNLSWHKLMLGDIKNAYKNTSYFLEFFPELEKIFDNSDVRLIDLNMKAINILKKAFQINTPIIKASELGLKPSRYDHNKSDASEDLVKICKKLNADIYLSGDGGKSYLNLEPFKREGIEVQFQEYKHPVYKQAYKGFIPCMSSIDVLFNVGNIFDNSNSYAEQTSGSKVSVGSFN